MRILVVEDEPAIAAGIRTALSDEGHAVDVVHSGAEALDRAAASPYDLIVLDIVLPGMSGLDVCRELRASGTSAAILMLTALTSVEDRVAGLDRGADDYLGKPFAIDELKARVRALARRPVTSGGPTIVVGDLELDPSRMTVTRAGRHIRLTAREFAVLELLARHPGQVFSKSHVLSALWPAETTPAPNIVEVFIRSLRRKIDGGRRQGIIETRRGEGYRLRAPAQISPSEAGRADPVDRARRPSSAPEPRR